MLRSSARALRIAASLSVCFRPITPQRRRQMQPQNTLAMVLFLQGEFAGLEQILQGYDAE